MSFKELAQFKDCVIFCTKKIFSVVMGLGRGPNSCCCRTFHIPGLLLAQHNIRKYKERAKLLLTERSPLTTAC